MITNMNAISMNGLQNRLTEITVEANKLDDVSSGCGIKVKVALGLEGINIQKCKICSDEYSCELNGRNMRNEVLDDIEKQGYMD